MEDIRFWTVQITDFVTETIANVSNRSVGNGPGNYALIGPGWHGTLPTGVVEIRIPQRIGFILQRILFEDREELQNRTRRLKWITR